MNNARTIAAIVRSIDQLNMIKDRLSAADTKASGIPARKFTAKTTMKRA